jgi:hypothetical protein
MTNTQPLAFLAQAGEAHAQSSQPIRLKRPVAKASIPPPSKFLFHISIPSGLFGGRFFIRNRPPVLGIRELERTLAVELRSLGLPY